MDTVIDLSGLACGLGCLVALSAVVRPWGPFKKRWQAGLLALVLAIGGGTLFQMPPERPSSVTEAEWARRIAVCKEHAVGAFRDCVRDPAALHKAEVAAKQAEVAAKAQATTPAAPGSHPGQATSKWEYTEEKDAMRGTVTKHATIESENEVEFVFPYSGGSHGELDVRQRPQDGLNIMLAMDKGQFSCSALGGRIAVKFDNGPVQTFSCGRATDLNGNVIFIRPAKKLVAEMKRSSTVTIEAEFFQEGTRQLTFDVRGLNWE